MTQLVRLVYRTFQVLSISSDPDLDLPDHPHLHRLHGILTGTHPHERDFSQEDVSPNQNARETASVNNIIAAIFGPNQWPQWERSFAECLEASSPVVAVSRLEQKVKVALRRAEANL